MDLPNGIPSHDTFRRVFIPIDPDAFEAGFVAWVGSLVVGFEREVVAIDGKTIRRSFDHVRDQSPLQVVSAWAKLVKLPLAQRVEYQRRMPDGDRQKDSAARGDYLLALKGNHSWLMRR